MKSWILWMSSWQRDTALVLCVLLALVSQVVGFENGGRSSSNQSSLHHAPPGEHPEQGPVTKDLQHVVNRRYIDSLASDLFKRPADRFVQKRYLDSIAGDLLKRESSRQLHLVNGELLKGATSRDEEQESAFDFNTEPEEERYDVSDKRHVDSLAGDLLKKNEGGPWDKRYVDAIAGDLLKRSDARWPASAKRYIDSIAGELLKRDDPQVPERDAKRYIDSIAGDLLKREPSDPYKARKRYIDAIAGDLLKRDEQGDKAKRYVDSIAGELLRRGHPYSRYDKRYIDSIAGDLLKKDFGHFGPRDDKQHMDAIAGELIRDNEQEKRYLDSIAADLLKRHQGAAADDKYKRYVDSIAGDLLKRESMVEAQVPAKRHIDSIAGDLLKRDSSINKQKEDKRHIDSIASDLMRRSAGQPLPEKRHLESIADDLIKRTTNGLNAPDKKHLDSIASELIKKDSIRPVNVPEYRDPALNDGGEEGLEKRHLDSIAGDLIKKSVQTDLDLEAELMSGGQKGNKFLSPDKRHLDSIAGDLFKKSDDKRFVDSIASDLIKREDADNDNSGSPSVDVVNGGETGLPHRDGHKRYIDSVADSLFKREGSESKRYLDSIASSLFRKKSHVYKRDARGRRHRSKRYIDFIASNLLKRPADGKRYLDSLASNLLRRNARAKRYLDSLAGDLLKRPAFYDHVTAESATDDMAESNVEDWTGTELQGYYGPTHHLDKRYLDSLASDLFKRDFDENGEEVSLGKRREETAEPLFSDASVSYYLQTMPSKRYLDSLAGDIFKRYFNPYVWATLKRNPYRRFPSRTYLDSLAGDLLKRDAHKRRKRYADLQTSELFKRKHHRIMPGWFLDAYPVLTYGVGDPSSRDGETATRGEVKPLTSKRFIDSIASHLLKKRSLENAALTLDDEKLTADDVISVSKRYLDTLASDLLD